MILYRFYKFLTNKLSFLAKWHMESRIKLGKEDTDRYQEKFGIAGIARPQGKLIWFHAASVGELNSILPLINELIPLHQNANFLVTTCTLTSARIMSGTKLERTMHQFCPFDIPYAIKNFLKHWSPDLAVFVESELWPNLIAMTSRKTKMVLINARLSDRSFKRWSRFPAIPKFMLSKFSYILPWSEGDCVKFQSFVKKKKINFLGNLKNASPALKKNKLITEALIKDIGDRKVWLAASTHEGEEEMIIAAHKLLKKKYKDLLTIILPRHPNRGLEIFNLAKKLHTKPVLRSTQEQLQANNDIYIADTIGEVGSFYHFVNIVFVGGSLIKHGGQNVLEAVKCKNAVMTGPHTSNFKDIVNKLADSLITVENVSDIVNQVSNMLENPEVAKKLANKALAIAHEENTILDDTVKFIGELINNVRSSS